MDHDQNSSLLSRGFNLIVAMMIILISLPLLVYLVQTASRDVTEGPSEPIETLVDNSDGLIRGDGYLVVKQNCTTCHSDKLITQNRATREGWENMIRWMQRTQNLWDLGANEPIILNYLARNYAPEHIGRRKPLEQIEWYELKQNN